MDTKFIFSKADKEKVEKEQKLKQVEHDKLQRERLLAIHEEFENDKR